MGEPPVIKALGRSSSRRWRRPTLKIALSFASIAAVALGAATLPGQATSSAAGHLSAHAVAKAACSPAGTGSDAIVNLDSHRSFPRLRTLCLGTLAGGVTIDSGIVERGVLYVLRSVGPAQSGNIQVVRVDLSTYALTKSTPLPSGGRGWLFTAGGDVWVSTSDYASIRPTLSELSPVSLRVLRRYTNSLWAFPTVEGRLWLLSDDSLEMLNPATRRVSVTRLAWLPAGMYPASGTASGDELYLVLSSRTSSLTMIATYDTVTRVARVVRAPELAGGSQVLAVTGTVLWVEPPGGNQHHVVAYSATTLRPLTDGFQNGGWNGSWLAVPDQGDLWF